MQFASECDDYPLENQYIIEMYPLGGIQKTARYGGFLVLALNGLAHRRAILLLHVAGLSQRPGFPPGAAGISGFIPPVGAVRCKQHLEFRIL